MKLDRFNKSLALLIIIFLISTLFQNFTYQLNEDFVESKINVQNKNLTICDLTFNQSESNININSESILEPRDIYIFPDYKNIFCFGKIVDFWEVEDGKTLLLYGTNNKVFNLLSFSGNLFLVSCLFYLYFKKKLKPTFILFSIVIFNFVLNELFLYNFNLINLFLNFNLFTGFFSPLLLLLPFVVKNNNTLLALIAYYLFCDYEFFPIFVIILFLSTKLNFQFNKFQKTIFTSFPVIFWMVKFITSLNPRFQNIWQQMGQRAYSGTTRYWDFQLEFMMYKCNKYKNEIFQVQYEERFISCPDIIGYGPLRKIINISGDLWNLILIAAFIMIFLVLIQYKDVLKDHKENYYIVTIIFLSPSLNLLINQMNTDIFFFVTLYWVLKYYEKNPIVLGFILFLFSLYKLHVLGIFVGLIVFFVLNKDLKNLKIASVYTLLIPVTYYFDTITTEPLKIPGAPDTKIGYGLLQDAKNISFHSRTFIELDYKVVYLILFFFVVVIFLMIFKKSDSSLNTSFIYSSRLYGLSFWFFLTMVYENHSYRLPLFFVLFITLFLNSSFNFRFTTLYFLFSNPIFILDPLTLSELNQFWRVSLVTNRISIYFFFAYLLYVVIIDALDKLNNNYDINLLFKLKVKN